MLYSIQDIYTVTAITVAGQFTVILLIRVLLRYVKYRNKVLNAIRDFSLINSMWWNLLLGVIEANVANIGFYGGIQFNMFVCFDFTSKLGLVAAVFAVFAALIFTLLFYPLLYRF